MNEPILTIVGNLGDDPELRFTPSGQAVCKFRVAQTPRNKSAAGEWVDGEPLWMQVTAWRGLAENCAESLTRGTRVVVTGRLKSRTYETREGEKRTVTELEADEVGAALTYATAKITKTSRSGGQSGGGDDWSGASKVRPAQSGPPANADQQRAAQAAAPAGAADSPW